MRISAAAHAVALLLRHRHAGAPGAHRLEPFDEIAGYVADSLGYLFGPGLAQAVGDPAWKSYCNACFTGNYLMLQSPQVAAAQG